MEYPQHKRIRATWHDYNEGVFFVTITTNHQPYFGYVSDGNLMPSPAAYIVADCIENIPKIYPDTEIVNYIIMPDHLHILIRIGWETICQRNIPGRMKSPEQFFNHRNSGLANIISSFKGAATKRIRKILPEFKWHQRFYDTIVCDTEALVAFDNYISNNPLAWTFKHFHR